MLLKITSSVAIKSRLFQYSTLVSLLLRRRPCPISSLVLVDGEPVHLRPDQQRDPTDAVPDGGGAPEAEGDPAADRRHIQRPGSGAETQTLSDKTHEVGADAAGSTVKYRRVLLLLLKY